MKVQVGTFWCVGGGVGLRCWGADGGCGAHVREADRGGRRRERARHGNVGDMSDASEKSAGADELATGAERSGVIRESHSVASSDGTQIAYQTCGDPHARPLLLLHGWAQSSLAWGDELLARLAETFRVIAMDLRGHGNSGAPAGGYDDSRQWADDVAAVLDVEGVGRNAGEGKGAGEGEGNGVGEGDGDSAGAIVLGWSYGGIVVGDVVANEGTGRIGGIVLCGATTSISRAPGGAVGDAMLAAGKGAVDPNPKRAIAALGSFGADMFAQQVGEGQQRLFGLSLATAPHVRGALLMRRVNNDEALAAVDVPALVIHGERDGIVLPSAGKANAETLGVECTLYPDVAHAPFLEAQERFVTDLEDFAAGL